jgi:hypothetical protein
VSRLQPSEEYSRTKRAHLEETLSPRVEILLFADLESPYFRLQKETLQFISRLKKHDIDFRFFDWSSPYHRKGRAAAARIAVLPDPLAALLKLSDFGIKQALGRGSQSPPSSGARRLLRHRQFGWALGLPPEAAWVIQGRIFDGTDPKANPKVQGFIRQLLTERPMLVHKLQRNLGNLFFDYRIGMWTEAPLGMPAKGKLHRLAEYEVTDVNDANIRDRIVVLGRSNENIAAHNFARARQLAHEEGFKVEFLTVPTSSSLEPYPPAVNGEQGRSPLNPAFELALRYNLQRLPITLIDGIPVSGPLSYRSLRSVWEARNKALILPTVKIGASDRKIVEESTPTIGDGQLLTIFADTAVRETRQILERLLNYAKSGKIKLALRHIPANTSESKSRAYALYEIAATRTTEEYWEATLKASLPKHAVSAVSRASVGRDIALANRIFGTAFHSYEGYRRPLYVFNGQWLRTGLDSAINHVD